MRSTSIAILALIAGAPASAQSLSTLFSGTTTLSGGNAGTFMDVTAFHAGGLTLDSFSVNCNSIIGTPVLIEVYYRPGSYVGFEQNPAGWTLLGAADTTSAGQGQPTPVPVGGLFIPSGQEYAVYINHHNGGVRYNSAATTIPSFQNADAMIELGAAQNALFGGTLTVPRGWNGTIHYTPGNNVVTGVCCLPTGMCAITTSASCFAQGGDYMGDFTTCASTDCPPPGACCLPDACILTSSAKCTALGGVFRGIGTPCIPADCGDILFSNGWMVNEVGTGLGGADISRASGLVNTAGSAAQPDGAGPQFRLAEDFIIAGAQPWSIDSITVYGYITAPAGIPYPTPPLSPFTAIDMRVWDGIPDAPGSSVVASSTNLLETEWTGIYRIFNTAVAATSAERPLMSLRVGFGNLQLQPGTYWVDYQFAGDFGGATAAWSPYVMGAMQRPAFTSPGNARQLVAAGWVAPASAFALPLTVRGSVGGGCYANCDGSTATPVLNVNDFVCFQQRFAAADPYANCDGSTAAPVLNVNDFVCFQQQFAAGCP